MAAFRLAFEQGADGVELDAKLTADGHVVALHDATLDRTTNGSGPVSSCTLADLRRLDAGSHFSAAFAGERIPTLQEVLECVGGQGLINIELTNYASPLDDLARQVCRVLGKWRSNVSVLLSSFLPRNLGICGTVLPHISRGLLALPGWRGAWARSFAFMFGSYQALHPHVNDTNRAQVRRVHSLGRRINVWTANEPKTIRYLAEIAADGIFSDDPLRARKALGKAE